MPQSPPAATMSDQLRARLGARVSIGENCEISPETIVDVAETGHLEIGDRVIIMRGTSIYVSAGATVTIGRDVAFGENVFVAAMVRIEIGDGCGISNMVDLHDHNHRDRTTALVPGGELTPWASGFEAAPIVLEPGVILSNKVTVTAGVHIGQNTKVGANSVVSRSLPHNAVAVGVPARIVRTYDGPLSTTCSRRSLRLSFFGTSIVEHLEADVPVLRNQADLPPVGSTVVVDAWVNRGFVQRLQVLLQATWPSLTIAVSNHGRGGATSRDLLAIVRSASGHQAPRDDLVFFGCGINDVWRSFQGRTSEAVDMAEYEDNCAAVLQLLTEHARHVICISETPFGLPDAEQMNVVLSQYNAALQRVAARSGAGYIDLWAPFLRTAGELAAWQEADDRRQSLWSDGVHLSELGDTLLCEYVRAYLTDNQIIQRLQTHQRFERHEAVQRYTVSKASTR